VQWTQTQTSLNAIIDGTTGSVLLPVPPADLDLGAAHRLGAGPTIAASARDGGILIEGLGEMTEPTVVVLPKLG
jgi:hypothetical protein